MRLKSHRFGGMSPAFRGDVTVPIEELGDAQLVAVVGENGTGKTTMLELFAAAIYRWLPSRKISVDDVANRCNSYIETVIGLRGHDYTAKQMLDAVARKTKAEVYLTRDGEKLASGKRDFKKLVAEHFPSKDLYFASGFAAQGGKGRFLDLLPSKRKELFADLLGCGRLQELSEAAGVRARDAEKTITGLRGKESQLEEQAGRLGAAQDEYTASDIHHAHAAGELEVVEADAATARQRLEEWHSRRAELAEAASAARSDLERARRELGERQRDEDRLGDELATVSAKRAKLEDQLAQRPDLESAVAAIERDQGALEDAKGELARLRRQQDEHRRAVDAWRGRRDEAAIVLAAAEGDLHTARDRIDREHREAVDAWREREREAEGRLSDAERALERAQDKIAQAHSARVSDWRRAREAADRRLKDAEAAHDYAVDRAGELGEIALANFERAEEQASGISYVPCGGEGDYSTCGLLAGAFRAKGQLDGLRETMAAAGRARAVTIADTTEIDAARAALDAIPAKEPADTAAEPPEAAAVTDAFAAANTIAQEGPPAKPTATLLESGAVAVAETDLSAVDADKPTAPDTGRIPALEELAERISQRLTVGAEARAKLEQLEMVAEQAAELDGEAAGIRTSLDGARKALAPLQSTEDRAARETGSATTCVAEHALAMPEAPDADTLTSARDAVASARDRQTTAKAAVGVAEEATGKLAGLSIEITKATVDLDDWKHLQKVLGRDGVQALLIDAAAPEVSELTNKLLHACYGSRFTVELKTAIATADGKATKEGFDLHVIDTERGTEGSANLKSGGEKVLIGEALGLALAIYNTRQSEIPIEDLVRDECAGALSSANAVRYIEMLRKALDLGDFHRCYFVAHQPHLWDLADARLLVANGDVVIADAGEIEISSAPQGEEAA